MDQIEVTSKADALRLWWLQKAVYQRENRRSLTGAHVSDGRVEAVNGFQLHILNDVPEPLRGLGEIVRLNGGNRLYKSAGRAYDAVEVEGVFPDVDSVTPKLSMEPRAVAHVNRGFLQDALGMPTNDVEIVTLRLYGGMVPVEIESEQAHALIMPMQGIAANEAKIVSNRMDEALRDKALMDWIREHKPKIAEEAEMAVNEDSEDKG